MAGRVRDSRQAAPDLAEQLKRFPQEQSAIPVWMAPQNRAQSLVARFRLMRSSDIEKPNHDRSHVPRNAGPQEESHAAERASRGSCFGPP